MITPKKPPKYTCEKCDFACSNKKDYNRHLATKKHKLTELEQNQSEKPQKTPNNYVCECGKEYKARNSLWYHKKICNYKEPEVKEDENIELESSHVKQETPDVSKIITPDIITTLMTQQQEVMKENKEFKELIVEQQLQQQQETQKLHSKLIEAAKEGKTINNINNNVNYNINLFLNDQCKDAMSLTDFIDNMKCKLEDLEDVGRLGYVDGISKLFIENLSGMEINKRPIHCTDLKRKSLYIKNNDEWTKDNNNVEMRKAINKVANKNLNNLNKWRDANPEHHQNGSGAKQQQYLKMSNEIQTFATDDDGKKGDKIIKNISDVVSIDRGMLKSGELEN